jgi:hypothetical protein
VTESGTYTGFAGAALATEDDKLFGCWSARF